ncbi:MAG: hypothetical protein RR980_05125 [Mucinivorans sp.]
MKIKFPALMRSGVHAGRLSLLALTILLAASCQHKQVGPDTPPVVKSVLVFNEGQYQSGNSSIVAYDPMAKTVSDDIFAPANNGAKLGDVPTSATFHDGRLFVPISGSGKIYVIDPLTSKLIAKITGLDSPRYIYFVDKTKAYVTNLNVAKITIINPETMTITGSIDTPTAAERLVKVGDYVYSNLWSYGNQVIKIDPKTNAIVGAVTVGVQPMTMVADKNGMLWVMCDGAQWDPARAEDASMAKIDPRTMNVSQKFIMPKVSAFGLRMEMDNMSENIYYLTDAVYKMSVSASALPTVPVVTLAKGVSGYSLGVNPMNDDIYVGDAVDYTQRGMVYRYSAKGELLDKFTAGIVPAFYYFSSGKM